MVNSVALIMSALAAGLVAAAPQPIYVKPTPSSMPAMSSSAVAPPMMSSAAPSGAPMAMIPVGSGQPQINVMFSQFMMHVESTRIIQIQQGQQPVVTEVVHTSQSWLVQKFGCSTEISQYISTTYLTTFVDNGQSCFAKQPALQEAQQQGQYPVAAAGGSGNKYPTAQSSGGSDDEGGQGGSDPTGPSQDGPGGATPPGNMDTGM